MHPRFGSKQWRKKVMDNFLYFLIQIGLCVWIFLIAWGAIMRSADRRTCQAKIEQSGYDVAECEAFAHKTKEASCLRIGCDL